MARIPDAAARVRPGWYGDMVSQACSAAEVAPGELLDWAIKQDGVSLILADGRKVTVPIQREPAEEDLSPRPPSLEGRGREEKLSAEPKKPAGRAAAK